MANLNPTLWRTCKMLAGRKRVELLRELHQQPGRSVTELGHAVGVKRSYASQELRRIQSRGLLKSARRGIPLIYRMDPDPQVLSASPLLKAIQFALGRFPPERDPEICAIANGLAHDRRIAIARLLMQGPLSHAGLLQALHMTPSALSQHLQPLLSGGWVIKTNKHFHLRIPAHPLARALASLIREPV